MQTSNKQIRDPKAKCILALDIETTGQFVDRDVCFGIGLVVATRDTAGLPMILKCTSLLTRLPVDPSAPGDIASMWRTNGYEIKTLDEFWSKYQDLFWHLQACGQVLADRETGATTLELNTMMGERFHQTLIALEDEFGRLIPVYDTVHNDPAWLSWIRMIAGHDSLCYGPSGDYCAGYELDSYIIGMLGLDLLTYDWGHDVAPFYEQMRPYIPKAVSNMHDPAIDAENIAYRFLLASYLLKEK